MNHDDMKVFGQTLYGEARGESDEGVAACAHVILNRVSRPGWWSEPDHDIRSVCLKAWQFSCWLPNDPNRAKLHLVGPTDKQFRRCVKIAAFCMAGITPDPTDAATHYCTINSHPKWAKGKMPNRIIGGHKFYKDID